MSSTGSRGAPAGLAGAAAARSSSPRLSLSGGHDSRLLAAALVHAGHRIVASTGGPAASADVVIARRVASTLGLEHKVDADPRARDTDEARQERARSGSRARSLPMTAERLAAWVALHDGTAPAELAWGRRDLSVRREIGARPREQLFSGLGGETHGVGIIYALATSTGPAAPAAARAASSTCSRAGRRCGDPSASCWRSSCVTKATRWAMTRCRSPSGWRASTGGSWKSFRHADILAQNDSAFWGFAPLMDLGFLALSREAPAAAKTSNRLVEDVTMWLAPEVARIPYDRRTINSPPEFLVTVPSRFGLRYVARAARRRLAGRRRSAAPGDFLRELWEGVYFGPGDHLWPELIDERRLRISSRTGRAKKSFAVWWSPSCLPDPIPTDAYRRRIAGAHRALADPVPLVASVAAWAQRSEAASSSPGSGARLSRARSVFMPYPVRAETSTDPAVDVGALVYGRRCLCAYTHAHPHPPY